jgi:hypothetical protein
MPQQGGRLERPRPPEGHADADADLGLLAVDDDRLGQEVDRPLGDSCPVGRTGHVVAEQGELVPAEPGGGGALAQARSHAVGDGHEQPVACLDADSLHQPAEIVNIDKQDRRLGRLGGAGKSELHAIQEDRSVDQTGQVVLTGKSGQTLLEPLPFSDIPDVDDDRSDEGLVEQVSRGCLVPAPTVVAAKAHDEAVGFPPTGAEPADRLADNVRIVGMHDGRQRRRAAVLRKQETPERRYRQDDRSFGREHDQPARSVLQHQAPTEVGCNIAPDAVPDVGLTGSRRVAAVGAFLAAPLELEREAQHRR